MKYLLLTILTIASLKSQAQFQNSFITKALSAGLELAAPSRSAYNIGFGVSAKFEIPVVAPVSISLTAGFTSLDFKTGTFNSTEKPVAARFVPLKAGVKYYVSPNLYFEGEAGESIETNYTKQSSFAFSIGPGFIIPFRAQSGIDLGFRYERWSQQLTETGIRFAYRFGL